MSFTKLFNFYLSFYICSTINSQGPVYPTRFLWIEAKLIPQVLGSNNSLIEGEVSYETFIDKITASSCNIYDLKCLSK